MIEIVETTAFDLHNLAVIDTSGGVWLTFAQPWWALADWLRYWLAAGERRRLRLRRASGGIASVRAVLVSSNHVRMASQ